MKVCPACGAQYADDAAFCARDRTPLRPRESGLGIIGQIIGDRYQVERRLGEGGMGEVYLARHVLMDRACALKVMTPALSRNPDAVSRFNREATNASRITHPNVCAIYDFGLTPDGLVYLAMEYVEGRTLSDVAAESGPMPVSRAAGLVTRAAAGLQAAHDLGIVHRDLKPDNIMVVAGRPETVKLVDFGIAKATEGVGRPSQQVTRTGFVVGTPEYMAPEQLAGDPLDGRADQYALALVFYRLVTGRLPFEGESAQDTMVQRLTTPPKPLESARPGGRFPPGLQPVMDRALARHARDRFESVTAFAQALEAAVSGDTAPTRVLAPAGDVIPPTRVASVAPVAASRTRRRVVAALGLVLAAGAVSAIVLTGDGQQAADTGAEGRSAAGTGGPDTTTPSSSRSDPVVTAPPSGPLAAPGDRVAVNDSMAPPPAVRAPDRAAAIDTTLPHPDDLDDPLRRVEVMRQERQILNTRGLPSTRRASAAMILAHGYIAYMQEASRDPEARRVMRDSARLFTQKAIDLNPKPEYRQLLMSLRDSVPQ